MDLSKAFDTANHELLIAKLHAYGFDQSSLKIPRGYVTNCLQRTKINTTFTSWTEIIKGVLKGPEIAPILLKKFLNHLLFLLKETHNCSCGDDTTQYTSDQNLDQLIKRLEQDSLLAVIWFESNYMKLNTDKCHL